MASPWNSEPINATFLRAVFCEFLGTLLFMAVGMGCVCTTTGIHVVKGGVGKLGMESSTLIFAMTFGLAAFMLSHLFRPYSGAHFNPAISFGFMVARIITPARFGAYLVAQCFGSILAVYVVMHILGIESGKMIGCNELTGPGGNHVTRAFITEFLLTFVIMLTFLASVDPKKKKISGPLNIALAIAIAHLIEVPINGCGCNPARSLSPALYSSEPESKRDLWVFLVAPFCGAAEAALLYPVWFAEDNFSGQQLEDLLKRD